MSLILKNTSFYYDEVKPPILNIDFLEFNSCINFLIGKNGSGKTTMLKALSHLNGDPFITGTVELDSKPLRNILIGLVTQNPLQSINTDLTFLENLLLAKTNGFSHISLKPQISLHTSEKVKLFLQSFKNWDFLSSLLYKEARNLSTGQQQLLAIFMRIIRFQRLLLLDECTASLDDENSAIIMGILLELAKKGTIIIFATHQIELLDTTDSEIYKIEYGTVKKQSKITKLKNENIN